VYKGEVNLTAANKVLFLTGFQKSEPGKVSKSTVGEHMHCQPEWILISITIQLKVLQINRNKIFTWKKKELKENVIVLITLGSLRIWHDKEIESCRIWKI